MRRLIDWTRFRFGIYWNARSPTLQELGITAGNALVVVCLVLVYGLVESHESRIEHELAAQRHAEVAARSEAAMLACMNGQATGHYTTDEHGVRHYIVCGDTYTINDENVTNQKGKT